MLTLIMMMMMMSLEQNSLKKFQITSKYKEDFSHAVKPPLQVYDCMCFYTTFGMQVKWSGMTTVVPWRRAHNSHRDHLNLIHESTQGFSGFPKANTQQGTHTPPGGIFTKILTNRCLPSLR